MEAWKAHDPVELLERELTSRGLLDAEGIQVAKDAAEAMAAALRDAMNAEPVLDPMDLFAHVYAEQTGRLREQAELLRAELEAENE